MLDGMTGRGGGRGDMKVGTRPLTHTLLTSFSSSLPFFSHFLGETATSYT